MIACPSGLLRAQSGKKSVAVFEENRVWQGNEGGKVMYHVYGLTATRKGVVLAFSEARYDHTDEGPHDLLCKRSTDGGKTWSESIVIEKGDGSFWRANGQPDKRECWANPAALADQKTGRVLFFYVLNEGQYRGKNTQRMTRVFYKTSDDDGQTWSERIEITDLLNAKADGSPNRDAQGKPVLNEDGFPCDYLGRAFHMPGPGHGIQLKNGRLLLQFWHRKAIGRFKPDGSYESVPSAERNYSDSVIYSDDQGKTWKKGGSTGLGQFVTESRLVELADGRVMLNGRIDAPKPPAGPDQPDLKNHPSKHRWVAISTDQGLTWQNEHIDQTLPPFTNVDCGFIRYRTGRKSAKAALLLSHPSELNARAGMTISASFDEGRTWPIHKPVFDGGTQYSDLVTLPDGSVGLLYGRAHKQPGQTSYGFRVDEVVFVRFNDAWLHQ
ncbi:exo-alpha-sialidase [Larkinella bovis]|uniref:exo-alpha-sialidase n=1 Tax=Larkinella bovis TaxID=683041 RepID=A0ABW0IGH2_9BACT